MILYPAIDLKEGEVVRLRQGRMEEATVFSDKPAEQAEKWRAAGFEWLHVVDLDGAIAGAPKNAGAVAAILDTVDIPVQLGGGVRSLDRIGYWLDAGVTRVVLGTAAVRDPDLVREAADDFPDRIAIAVDVKAGKVAVEGWVESTEIDAVDLAKRFEDAGVASLIVTDIDRDGLNEGVNVDLTGRVADAVTIPVIASGGLAGAGDIAALKARPGRPIAGAVIGRALYDGRLTPADALAAARG